MNTRFALEKNNLYFILAGVILIVIGFCLMMGAPSTKEAYNPDIFSFRRIVVAPTVSFIGFVVVLVGILIKPKGKDSLESSDKIVEK